MSVGRLLRTLRHLTPEQLVGQVRVRAQRAVGRPIPGQGRAPAFEGVATAAGTPVPPRPAGPPQDVTRGVLCFLNEPRCVADARTRRWDWTPDGASLLWRYNLHYFDYLWDIAPGAAQTIALDWTDHHRPRAGAVGWEPYPTSLRIQNWALLFFVRQRTRTVADAAVASALWSSLWAQTEHLSRRLETHLQGNHLLENAVALTMAGAIFRGPAAAVWKARGLSLLSGELHSQVLLDGVHYERSPMYQLHVLRALRNLQCIGDAEVDAVVATTSDRMLLATRDLLHPDGQLALLNDAALNVEPDPVTVVSPGASGIGWEARATTFQLPAAGYFGARNPAPGSDHYLVCDAGPVGPDHIPGHAHADTLGFELSLFGRRLVVDTGTYDYLPTEMRAHCRSTAAHNTVEIDGRDQSEMWSAFRVGHRARPRDVAFEAHAAGFSLNGSHDGYARLPGSPVHHREFRWLHAGRLIVVDRITAGRPVVVRSRIHLHPDARVVAMRGQSAVVAHAGHRVEVWYDGDGHLALRRAVYCPELGVQVQTSVLVYSQLGADVRSAFCLSVEPLKAFTLDGGPVLQGGDEVAV